MPGADAASHRRSLTGGFRRIAIERGESGAATAHSRGVARVDESRAAETVAIVRRSQATPRPIAGIFKETNLRNFVIRLTPTVGRRNVSCHAVRRQRWPVDRPFRSASAAFADVLRNQSPCAALQLANNPNPRDSAVPAR